MYLTESVNCLIDKNNESEINNKNILLNIVDIESKLDDKLFYLERICEKFRIDYNGNISEYVDDNISIYQ
jgi:hypothetical protein